MKKTTNTLPQLHVTLPLLKIQYIRALCAKNAEIGKEIVHNKYPSPNQMLATIKKFTGVSYQLTN